MIKSFSPELLQPPRSGNLPEQTFTYGPLTVTLIQEDFTIELTVTGDEKMSDDAILAMSIYLGFDPEREIQTVKMMSNRFYRCLMQRRG